MVKPAVLAIMFIVAVLFIGLFAAWLVSVITRVAPPVVPVEYDGEWDKIYDPDEVSGTDLSITDTSITEDATLRVANMSYDLNGTDGQTAYLAFGISISSNGFEKMQIDGALESPTTTSELQIRKAYILKDEEGVNLDATDAIYTGTVDTDQDEFEFDIDTPVEDNDYVLCVEVKGITTSGIASGDALLKIDFDATTEEDVDAFTLYIHNA